MMAPRWWRIEIPCPKCGKAMTVQDVMFSADGELRYLFFCFQCKEAVNYLVYGEAVNYLVYGTALSHRALLNDIQADKSDKRKDKVSQPLVPPLAINPPLFTDEDRKFAHELRIDLKEDDK